MDFSQLWSLPADVGLKVWSYVRPSHPTAAMLHRGLIRCWCGTAAVKQSAAVRPRCELTRYRFLNTANDGDHTCPTCRGRGHGDWDWDDNAGYFSDVWGIGIPWRGAENKMSGT